MKTASILIVDDEPAALGYLALALQEQRYRVRSAGNGVEALLAMEEEPPDLVISDLQMPVMDGMELLGLVRQRWPDLPVVVMTVTADIPTVVRAVQLGACNYMVKPAAPAAILSTVHRALLGGRPGRNLAQVAHEIVGSSRNAIEVRHLVTLAARCDVNVLITGETGTGKELVARAIHRYSRHAGGPFVAHNCAATPADLFESQFFGHCRGAFTGADRDQTGLLERASGGILFLDELEALASIHQAKLLRVLDDGEIRRLGSAETRHIAVRFLAASNQDPVRMIRQGTLREDLYYRLRGFEIALAPLRERMDDLPALVHHFLGEEGPGIEPAALAALSSFSWPGNVRELFNVLSAARARASGGRIAAGHLALGVRARASAPATMAPRGVSTLQDIEEGAILDALRLHGGNKSRAAQSLGIDRSTLRRKLQGRHHRRLS